MGSQEKLTTWIVQVDFRRGVASFETTVTCATANEAKLRAIQAACDAGWAEAEVRKMVLYPQVVA